ncbi:UDP-glucose 6-dehydrogenase [Candidatus Uhrbacteria bacterium CG_4_9_14_0_2_um_filter_41_50]|uniref:UDP-glucose 6-dehydrogenase n=1 Tax=Candidatus Uhrbacteria bacterium CG_4_9_14_0_2_um_filter_41_50 TaxID=1975031 RepID=A0A2M8EQK0_9BACT|nr:MAG: UDP-glucose 6-dehydrogenase [Candidatus Uhrbacteria bacterium CG_4_10_14_3_um_filter_41_21]PIZ55512.1 MAG: UDP-glucose 6-dehydrogenase [Candidatus Uhrbacteria bacterium CG_4_10_14_0_2_um_filter_41_21]PJB84581.1 MAG: UDP-glucose 6-dehydrogenase [Candidatus Uhrbacteria bacterium CG_4_9_14_0_8_um_filter_41_16]PJC24971.1 MAG: UDP-glucose 6-dehydrogenase [Candidatus Uhrbacteria bacterium CG_4_9_14_0_2_um_filter_41_50]PJE74673.1 MAG: UDP-glucose 6-dehydrogenase [Candidatus Uhrbacteria bacteri
MKIAIIGTGYVGLVSGACFAESGHDVSCMDVDENKINDLTSGIISIYEPELKNLVVKNLKEQKLKFTTSMKEAVQNAQLIFICVGTPPKENGSADLRYVLSVADEIGKYLSEGSVIVIKSTVPAGTDKTVRDQILRVTKKSFFIASNPEFLGEGTAVHDFMNPHRTIIGIDDEEPKFLLRELYSDFPGELLFMTIESAMMAKYASNAFLATKISFINEIANLCECVGANIDDVARGMSLDPRIGKHFLKAGIGYGGSCFPKDVRALYQIASEHEHDFHLLKSVIEVNNNQRIKFFGKIKKELGDLNGKNICILGLSFKPNTDDIRESIGIDLAQKFSNAGAEVVVYDPRAMNNAKKVLLGVEFADSLNEAIQKTDAIVIATDWAEFRAIDSALLKEALEKPIIFDGRNLLNYKDLIRVGYKYFAIGR